MTSFFRGVGIGVGGIRLGGLSGAGVPRPGRGVGVSWGYP